LKSSKIKEKDDERFKKIADLSNGDDKNKGYLNKKIPLWAVNILAQPRKTFDDIEELGEGIASDGLINPLTVGRFSHTECKKYLEVLNVIRKTSYSISSLKSIKESEKKYYYLLLGGERRTRGMKLLWKNGCSFCRTEYGQESPGECYRRHFGNELVDIRFRPDISPVGAIFSQSLENTHKRVPIYEEAEEYYNFFRFLRMMDPKFPLATFARRVGRSEESVRNALRFCELPESIQNIVKKNNGKHYSLAVETGRLFTSGINPGVAELWLFRAIVENKPLNVFKKNISEYLLEINSGQQSLFDIFSEEQEKEYLARRIKKVAAENLVIGTHNSIAYCKQILRLFETESLGLKDSPFSEKSPVKIFSKFVELLEEALPHFQRIRRKKFKEAEKPILKTIKILEKIS
jgi:hypothetical protein